MTFFVNCVVLLRCVVLLCCVVWCSFVVVVWCLPDLVFDCLVSADSCFLVVRLFIFRVVACWLVIVVV